MLKNNLKRMNGETKSRNSGLNDGTPVPVENSNAAVFEQLRRIQDSHSFCNSPRSKEFLSYVVEHGLHGREELLKERSIGINLFHRNPAYITSDDPIVRVKAAEVRRRLAQFYAEEKEAPEVRIEIPVGSYIPKFHWRRPISSAPSAQEVEVVQQPLVRPNRLWRRPIIGLVVALMVAG